MEPCYKNQQPSIGVPSYSRYGSATVHAHQKGLNPGSCSQVHSPGQCFSLHLRHRGNYSEPHAHACVNTSFHVGDAQSFVDVGVKSLHQTQARNLTSTPPLKKRALQLLKLQFKRQVRSFTTLKQPVSLHTELDSFISIVIFEADFMQVRCAFGGGSSVVCGSGPGRTHPHNRRYLQHCGRKQPQPGRTATVESNSSVCFKRLFHSCLKQGSS